VRGIPTGTAGNKRIYEKRVDGSTQEWFHYFGITGQRLARFTFTVSGAVITFAEHENSVWFGGKLVRNAGSWTNEDRLGSVGKYLPYGEDKPGASGNPANDSVKFATYTRDAGTGIDYADQRWHAQGVGRFLTSDPYQASAGPGDPGSWNRYGYVGGDPIGYPDSTGLLREGAGTKDLLACLFTRPAFWSLSQQYDSCMAEGGGGGGTGNTTEPPPVGRDQGGNLQSQDAWDERRECYKAAGLNLNALQLGILNGRSWDSLRLEQQAAFLNFTANAAATGLSLGGLRLDTSSGDRITLTGDSDVVRALIAFLESSNQYSSGGLTGQPHAGYTHNFRQNTTLMSMQINLNPDSGSVEIDIDYGNPNGGLAGLLVHAVEVGVNRTAHTTTNPHKVAWHLRRRPGVNLGHDCH